MEDKKHGEQEAVGDELYFVSTAEVVSSTHHLILHFVFTDVTVRKCESLSTNKYLCIKARPCPGSKRAGCPRAIADLRNSVRGLTMVHEGSAITLSYCCTDTISCRAAPDSRCFSAVFCAVTRLHSRLKANFWSQVDEMRFSKTPVCSTSSREDTDHKCYVTSWVSTNP